MERGSGCTRPPWGCTSTCDVPTPYRPRPLPWASSGPHERRRHCWCYATTTPQTRVAVRLCVCVWVGVRVWCGRANGALYLPPLGFAKSPLSVDEAPWSLTPTPPLPPGGNILKAKPPKPLGGTFKNGGGGGTLEPAQLGADVGGGGACRHSHEGAGRDALARGVKGGGSETAGVPSAVSGLRRAAHTHAPVHTRTHTSAQTPGQFGERLVECAVVNVCDLCRA